MWIHAKPGIQRLLGVTLAQQAAAGVAFRKFRVQHQLVRDRHPTKKKSLVRAHFEFVLRKVFEQVLLAGEAADVILVHIVADALGAFGNQQNLALGRDAVAGGIQSFLGLIQADVLRQPAARGNNNVVLLCSLCP